MEGFYSVYQRDSYKEKRKEMLKKIFQPTDETCLEEFLNVLYQEKKRPNKQEKGVVHMRAKIWIWGTGNWTDRFIYLGSAPQRQQNKQQKHKAKQSESGPQG